MEFPSQRSCFYTHSGKNCITKNKGHTHSRPFQAKHAQKCQEKTSLGKRNKKKIFPREEKQGEKSSLGKINRKKTSLVTPFSDVGKLRLPRLSFILLVTR